MRRRAVIVVAAVVIGLVAPSASVVVVGAGAGPAARPSAATPAPRASAATPSAPVSNARWFRAVTIDLLGARSPEADVTAAVARLTAGTSRATVARELARSQAWTEAVVTELYRDVLGRDPEAGGLAYWSGRLQGGTRVADVAASIYSSDELYTEVGGTPGAYVDALYEGILHRPADPDGRAYWADAIEDGLPRWRMSKSFFLSSEARGDRVDALYESLLGRAAEPGGRAYWIGRLAVVDDIELVVSPEYLARSWGRFDTVGPGTVVGQRPGWYYSIPHHVGVSGDGTSVVTLDDIAPTAWDATSGASAPLIPELLGKPEGTVIPFFGPSYEWSQPSLSDDGRFVVMADWGVALVDRWEETTQHIGPQGWDAADRGRDPALAPDGSTLVYHQVVGGVAQVVVRDVAAGTTAPITAGNGASTAARLSGDGNLVVFASAATDLVAGDDNGQPDVFLHDRTAGTTVRVTDGDGPSGQPWISADGTSVAFTSTATDLVPDDVADDGAPVDAYVWSRSDGTVLRVSDGAASADRPSISGAGRVVAYTQPVAPGAAADAMAWDRQSGEIVRLDDGAAGASVTVREAQVSTDGGSLVGIVTAASYHAPVTLLRWALRDDLDRLTLAPTPLPDAAPATPYSATLAPGGGTGTEVLGAHLPRGLERQGASLTGVPGWRPGPVTVPVWVGDSTGRASTFLRSVALLSAGTIGARASIDIASHYGVDVADDGSIAYVSTQEPNSRLRVSRPNGTDQAVAQGYRPEISADGDVVAYVGLDAQVWVVGRTGAPRLVYPHSVVKMALSNDGTTLVVSRPSGDPAQEGIWRVDVATGVAERIAAVPVGLNGDVATSADGSVIAYEQPLSTGIGKALLWHEGGAVSVMDQSWVHDHRDFAVSDDGTTVHYRRLSHDEAYPSVWRRWTGGPAADVDLDPNIILELTGDGATAYFNGDVDQIPGRGAEGKAGDVYRLDLASGEVSFAVAPGGAVTVAPGGEILALVSSRRLVPSTADGIYALFSWTPG